MNYKGNYSPPSREHWQGRQDSLANSSFFQRIELLNLSDTLPLAEGLVFVLLGFACDEGVRRNHGRTGAAEGPDAVRGALAKLAIHRMDAIIYDAGNITCTDQDLEGAQKALGAAVHQLLVQGCVPIVLGGGHEMAWGHYQGIAETYPTETLGILNLDAHFDMRALLPGQQGSSGTPFLQIAMAHEHAKRRLDYNCLGIQRAGNSSALFETANHYAAHFLQADEMVHFPDRTHSFIERVIQANQRLYLSLCLDVFSPAFAPGVSAPQVLGLSPWQAVPCVRQVAASGKTVSYDIAELSPQYDPDRRTARLAAHFVHEIIHFHSDGKS